MQLACTRGAGHRAGLVDARRLGDPHRRYQSGGGVRRLKLERPVCPVPVAGSARGAVPAFRRARFPGPPSEPGVPVIPAPGAPRGPLPTNGCVAARLRSTGLDCPVGRRYSPAAPALPTRPAASLCPFALWPAFPDRRLLRALRHDPPPTADDAPARRTKAGGRRRVASHVDCHPVDEVGAQLYPGSLTRVRRSPSPWPPHRPLPTGYGVARRNRDGRALLTGPPPPGWSRHVTYGASTLVPRVHLLVLLAGPGPSGSTGPSRRCQDCPPPCVSTVRLPSASPACCDRPAAGPLPSRPVVVAPRGAGNARHRPGGPPPRGLAQRSAASPGTPRAPYESTAPRRRSRWAPAPASPAPRRPRSRTRHRTRGRTSRLDREQESAPGVLVLPRPAAGCGPAG